MIACGGEALIDFTQGEDGRYTPHPGGSPYNVAVALARQEVPTVFLGQISRDLFGEQLLSHLLSSGVATRHVARSERPSTLAFVDTRSSAEPQYAFYATGAADVELSLEALPAAPGASLTHLGSISLMQEPCGRTWEQYAGAMKGRLSLDPNIRPGLIADREAYLGRFGRLLARTTLLRLSRADLEWLRPGRDEAGAACDLLTQGPALVVVTAGKEGATLYAPEFTLFQPAFPVTVADTVGAGDTFTAGFLAELHRRDFPLQDAAQLQLCLRWGAACASLCCQQVGAHPPTFAETLVFDALHGSRSEQEVHHAQP